MSLIANTWLIKWNWMYMDGMVCVWAFYFIYFYMFVIHTHSFVYRLPLFILFPRFDFIFSRSFADSYTLSHSNLINWIAKPQDNIYYGFRITIIICLCTYLFHYAHHALYLWPSKPATKQFHFNEFPSIANNAFVIHANKRFLHCISFIKPLHSQFPTGHYQLNKIK